ncbi:MAG: hypothetical protein N4A74_14180 [Carboxylicivirga sp.]|jgi:hypothetical protein|nr:hypothetical protein [Carboxylicivirga sp.]
MYRITKYHHNKLTNHEEWTSISDIGKTFDGVKLSKEEYLKIEKNYIDACILLFDDFKSDGILIKELDKIAYGTDGLDELYNDGLLSLYKVLDENKRLSRSNFVLALQLVLRENIWCKMSDVNNSFLIEFGYDYYMYFNVNYIPNALKEKLSKMALFIEEI